MNSRIRIVVRGLVQGVGFRYFVQRAAREHGVVGFAENLPTGEVLIVAEGERAFLEEVLKATRIGPRSARVTGVAVEWENPTGEYSTFEVQ